MQIPEEKRLKYLKQLESLYRVFLGVKMLYHCTIPSNEFVIKNEYFHFLNVETRKLILGKLQIILSDRGKNKKYNTISFKILIKNILNNASNTTKNETLNSLLTEIENIDSNYANYRDKIFAHIELDKENSLTKVEISNKKITDLLTLAQKAYDQVLLFLDNASSDHMEEPIESLSKKLWNAYETIGLVKSNL